MFDSRQKCIYQVTFLAESIDLQTSKSSLPVMQFDDSEALSTKGLCSRETSVTKDGIVKYGEGNSISDAKSPNNEAVKDASTLNAGSLQMQMVEHLRHPITVDQASVSRQQNV